MLARAQCLGRTAGSHGLDRVLFIPNLWTGRTSSTLLRVSRTRTASISATTLPIAERSSPRLPRANPHHRGPANPADAPTHGRAGVSSSRHRGCDRLMGAGLSLDDQFPARKPVVMKLPRTSTVPHERA